MREALRTWGIDLRFILSKPVQRELCSMAVMAVCACAVAIVTYFCMVEPSKQRLARAEAAFEQAKRAQQKSWATTTLHEKVRQAQQQVERIMSSLPSRQEYATLAMAVSELAKAEAVIIPGMTYHIEKEEGDRPVKATLSFRVTGEYSAIYRLIHRLEAASSYLVIESLDATRADKTSRPMSHLVVCNVVVATFLRPTPLNKESL